MNPHQLKEFTTHLTELLGLEFTAQVSGHCYNFTLHDGSGFTLVNWLNKPTYRVVGIYPRDKDGKIHSADGPSLSTSKSSSPANWARQIASRFWVAYKKAYSDSQKLAEKWNAYHDREKLMLNWLDKRLPESRIAERYNHVGNATGYFQQPNELGIHGQVRLNGTTFELDLRSIKDCETMERILVALKL